MQNSPAVDAQPRLPSRRPAPAIAASGWRDRPATAYAVAIVATGAAALLTWAAREELPRVIFVLFFAAVSLTAWIGGLRPTIVAVTLSALSVDQLFFAGDQLVGFRSTDEIVPMGMFALVGCFVGYIGELQRRADRAAAELANQLQEQNIELEVQMEESQALQEELEQTGEELTQANDALLRNRDFLEQAQATAQLGSWEWDLATNVVTWSDQMYRVYGLEPQSGAVSFETFSDAVHPEDREMVHQAIRASMESREPFRFDHRVVWPNGTIRWVNGRGRPILDASGTVIAMMGSGQDVTDRKRAAESQRLLAETSEVLAASLDYQETLRSVASMAVRELADWCSIAIGDSTGRYENLAVAHRDPQRVKWAEEYSRLNPPRFDTPTGVPNVLRTGKSEFYPELSEDVIRASAQTEDERRVITELRMRSAMVVPMVARGRTIGAITFIAAESGRTYTADDLWLAERLANRAAIAVDNARLFEETKAARAEAEAANAAKAQFLASMSHELRTPLNAIAGYAELMELEVLGPVTDKQRDAIARLQRGRKHLSALVDQVLGFARLEAGKVHFELTDVPVAETLMRLGEFIASQAADKRLRYEFDGGDPAVMVRADPDRLDQIVLNLLVNAVKFTPEGGSIRLSAGVEGASVLITVTDTGPGIPDEKQRLIFQPFVQLGSNTETGSTGIGLGLAISRELAHGMAGEVTVESSAGQGSRFIVRLPRAFVASTATLPDPHRGVPAVPE